MDKKKIKVKVKKKKLKFKNIILVLLIIYLLYFSISHIINMKITNIYIVNNKIIKDSQIIKDASLDDYPSFILTLSRNIKKDLLKNDFIKNVKIKKKFFGKIIIEVEEQKALFIDKNQIVLENEKKLENIYNISEVPILINEIDKSIYEKTINSFKKIDDKILLKISQIEYCPVELDKERFLFYMNDGNYVYINLNKIENINKYEEIYDTLENKHGIIYLDSGNYFEEK